MAQSKFIYGIHAVLAALQHHPENILTLYCASKEPSARLNELLSKATELEITIQYLSPIKLDKMTHGAVHQDIAAKIRTQQVPENAIYEWLETAHPSKVPFLLLLEGIQDPHNLGACLRSAESLGVDWVVVPQSQSAPLNATVSKVACGADQTLPVVTVSNLVRFITQIQQRGVWVVGTALADNAIPLMQAEFKRPLAVVMGAEGKGLKQLTLKTCDEVVKIPLVGKVASLNVSVATGICLYEVLRQRQMN